MKMLKIVGSIALAIISVSGQSSTNVPTNAPIINNAAINESDSASNDDWDDDKNKTGDYIDVMNEDDYPFIGNNYNDTAINDSDSTSNETWDDENSNSNTRHLLSGSYHDYNKREMNNGDYMDQHEKEHDDESYNVYNRRNADGRNKEYSPRLVSTSYDDGSKNRNDHKGYVAMYGRNQNDVSSHSYSKSSMDSSQGGRNNDNGDYIDTMNEDDIDGYSAKSKGHYNQIYDDWQKERKTDDAADDDRYDRNNGDDRNKENSNYNTRHLLSGSYHDYKKETEMNNKGYGAMYGRNNNDDDKHSPNMDKSYNIYNRRNADGRNKQHSRRLSSKNRDDDKHDDRSKTYQGGRNNNNNDHNDDKKNENKDKHNIRRLLHDSKDNIFGQNNDIFTIFQNDPRFSQSNDDEDDDIRDE